MQKLYWQYNSKEFALSDKIDRLKKRYVKLFPGFHNQSDKSKKLLDKIIKLENDLKVMTHM